jgi:hypothetical protein
VLRLGDGHQPDAAFAGTESEAIQPSRVAGASSPVRIAQRRDVSHAMIERPFTDVNVA